MLIFNLILLILAMLGDRIFEVVSLDVEPFFQFDYNPPTNSQNTENITKLTPLSGQMIRLRGISNRKYGFLEVQGAKPGWGVICQTKKSWDLEPADIICRQMGYPFASMAWKGYPHGQTKSPALVAASYVHCKGDETLFQLCEFRNNSTYNITRDSVGVECLEDDNNCHEDEVYYNGFCYHLATLNISLHHAEAEQHCNSRNSSLLYITKQRENNFVSEWLIQEHPKIESVIIDSVEFSRVNRSQWHWKSPQKTNFDFSKWWPGWNNEKIQPPLMESKSLCIIMKKKFPCDDKNPTLCETDYFFWDVQDCTESGEKSYLCKRPDVRKDL